MDLVIVKTDAGIYPGDQKSLDWFSKQETGTVFKVKVQVFRNYRFHKKGMALLNYLFDLWEPGEINSKYGTPEKNFERFRKDLTILAGFYEMKIRLNGEAVPEAKSISFEKMDEGEFEKWYNSIIDVGLKYICKNYSGEELKLVVDQLMDFA